jgi:hypothetical protein
MHDAELLAILQKSGWLMFACQPSSLGGAFSRDSSRWRRLSLRDRQVGYCC